MYVVASDHRVRPARCDGTPLIFLNEAVSAQVSILNFQADNGHEHDSKGDALKMIETIAVKNGWKVKTSRDTALLTYKNLLQFNVIIFNKNCGNAGRIFSSQQQKALQQFIRQGGGFVGTHCAGALWHEGGDFKKWYGGLVGTQLVNHPKSSTSLYTIEDKTFPDMERVPSQWKCIDEIHTTSHTPRSEVHVLLSVDEISYEGDQKMNGDHPVAWYQYYDGDSAYFNMLGRTREMYKDVHFMVLLGEGPSDFPDFAEFLLHEGITSISLTPDSVKTIRVLHKTEEEIKNNYNSSYHNIASRTRKLMRLDRLYP